MTDALDTSAMARETAEIPSAASRLLARADAFALIAERIKRAKPRTVVFCGRGSSGHVGVYLRYLFEARLGVLASAAAPSVMTAYQQVPAMHDVLFVVVSQSGHSPDIVMATQRAREFGALTLAIINDSDSPAAAASELVLPIGAGPELSVAATKSVVLSMIAGTRLVATLAPDHDLDVALTQLPHRLSNALGCDWSIWADLVAESTAAFVVARGYGLGCAREIALKISEILRIPALGYSAAELQHGPRASISARTPVLALRQSDQAARTVDDFVSGLHEVAGKAFTAGGPAGTLPWIGDDHPVCDPIVMLIPAYRAIELAARKRGFDPDKPPYLSKVTRTL
jgi:glucosamine--fructose-6-phosphate aminotransferase (isomerizing)